MFTLTKERVAFLPMALVLILLLGPEPAFVAGAVAGVVFSWWLIGPRASSEAVRPPETRV
jgi:hypothetical protein